jgi:hypothetical protein
MADFTKHQQGIVNRYYEHLETITVTKLAEIVSDLAVETDGGKLTKLWNRAHKGLKKLSPDPLRAAKVIATRDVAGLAKLVGEIQAIEKAGPKRTPEGLVDDAALPAAGDKEPAPAPPPPPPPPTFSPRAKVTHTPQELKTAFNAFKKRLKLTKLDQESRISGNRPTTGGADAGDISILPPREYPKTVWEQLVKEGRLVDTGGGFYKVATAAPSDAKKAPPAAE